MRPIEFLISCLALAGSTLLLAAVPLGAASMPALLALFACLLVIHLLYEGAHWQMGPLYLALAGLLVVSILWFIHARTPSLVLRIAGGIDLLLVLATMALSWLLPMFRLPKPTGKYQVGTRILYMADPKRDAEGGRRPGSRRELMVQVWYPTSAARGRREVYRRLSETTLKSSYQSVLGTQSLRNAPVLDSGAPCPLLIFNPAWTGQRTQSTFLMQELASHGFIVASIDHTYYSGLVAFPDGRVFDGHMAPALGDFTYLSVDEGIDLGNQFVRILAEDVIFVVDQMGALNEDPRSPWHNRVDMARVGSLGHSVGGAAAAEAAYLDPRIRAALNLDGWTFGEVLEQGLAKPWMVIYGKGIEVQPRDLQAQSEGVQRYWQMNRRNHAAVEAHLRENGGYCLNIEGASHWNFSDRPLYSPLRSQTNAGTIAAAQAHRIIADATRAFFTEAFHQERRSLVAAAVHPYREAELVLQPAGAPETRSAQNR